MSTGCAGTCQQLPTQCEDTARWCGTPGHNSTATQLAQELMAGQLANALFGWVDATANDLFSDEPSIINAAGDPEEQNLEEQYRRVYEGVRGAGPDPAMDCVSSVRPRERSSAPLCRRQMQLRPSVFL